MGNSESNIEKKIDSKVDHTKFSSSEIPEGCPMHNTAIEVSI